MGDHIRADSEPPECFRRIKELLNSTEIQHLQSDTGSLNVHHRNLKRDCNAVEASLLSDNQELLDELDALKKTLAAKDAEIHSLRASGNNITELAHVVAQLQALKDDSNTLLTQNRLLQESVNEFKVYSKASSDHQATVSELQAKLTSEQKISEQLTTKLTESSSALEQITDLSQRLRSRSEDTETELEELRAKLDAAEKDRDQHHKQHAEISEARASDLRRFNQNINQLREENNQLKQDNDQPKQENLVLAQKLRQCLQDIGSFIADLDLAAEEMRVYTCSHNSHADILPKSDKSTRIKPMWMIANEMYKHWASDAEFREGYMSARRTVCFHHIAHSKAGHHNSDEWGSLLKIFNELDQKRGIRPCFS